MRARNLAHGMWLTGSLLLALQAQAQAAEYAFSSYGLGSVAFAAGLSPPPGTYVTAAAGFYDADIGNPVRFGGLTINAGAEVKGFSNAGTFFMCRNKNYSMAVSD